MFANKTRLTKRICLMLASTLIALLVAEFCAWASFRYRGEDPRKFLLSPHAQGMQIEGRYVSHPFLPFALRPSYEAKIVYPPYQDFFSEPMIWNIKTNRWGFRGREVDMEKPANTIRVVCLGGSTTYDTATDGKTWPEKLERLLRETHAPQDVQVLNFGMNAASLPFNIVQFATLGVHFQPDLVIVYAGHNDLWSGLGLEGFRPDYSHRLGHWDDSRKSMQRYVPSWAMKSALVTGLVVGIDRRRGIEYDLVRQIMRPAKPSENGFEGDWAFYRGLVTLKGIANVHGARLLVITPHWGFWKEGGDKMVPGRSEFQQEFAERVGKAAQEADIAVLDAFNLFPVGDKALQIDDCHFSDKGGSLFARMIADGIASQHLLD